MAKKHQPTLEQKAICDEIEAIGAKAQALGMTFLGAVQQGDFGMSMTVGDASTGFQCFARIVSNLAQSVERVHPEYIGWFMRELMRSLTEIQSSILADTRWVAVKSKKFD